jgi:hypothetical protein
MVSEFVTPAAGWRPQGLSTDHAPQAPDSCKRPGRRQWTEDAGDGDWAAAVLGYLRERRRDAVNYWRVVNEVVLASTPLDRRQVRCNTRQVLTAVQALLKARRVLRYRRRFLVILDTGDDVIPLAAYFALPWRTATGRCAADSTRIS